MTNPPMPQKWAGSEPEPKTYRVSEPARNRTLTQLLQWAQDKGLSPDEATLVSGHLAYYETEEPERTAARLEGAQRRWDTHCEFIANRYRELFGDPT